jgi:hypothetical protein
VDSYLVEQACSEQVPGDIRAQHQDDLVPRGLLGAPGRSLQPVEGKQPAVLTEQVRLGAMGDHAKLGKPGHGVPPHGPTPRSNVRHPMTVAPTVASNSRRTPTSISISASGPFRNIHSCRRSPPSPIGSASRTFGPASWGSSPSTSDSSAYYPELGRHSDSWRCSVLRLRQ